MWKKSLAFIAAGLLAGSVMAATGDEATTMANEQTDQSQMMKVEKPKKAKCRTVKKCKRVDGKTHCKRVKKCAKKSKAKEATATDSSVNNTQDNSTPSTDAQMQQNGATTQPADQTQPAQPTQQNTPNTDSPATE